MAGTKLANNVWLTAYDVYAVAREKDWKVAEDYSIDTEKGTLWVDKYNQIYLGETLLIARQGNVHKPDKAAAREKFLKAYEEAA